MRGTTYFHRNGGVVDLGQYEALTAGAALVRRPSGRLRCVGEDALDLLNRLSTNALMGLADGTGAETVLTSNKGRIVDLVFALKRRDDLLLLTSAGNETRVREWLDFYTIIEDVEVEDITGRTAAVSVVGPGASDLLSGAASSSVGDLEAGRSAELRAGGVEATAIRRDLGGITAFDLVSSAADGAALCDAIAAAGAVRVGHEALELVRIEQGSPAFGAELSEAYNPLEAGLQPIISYTKGCYVGQEVIARLTTYDKVQKRLVRLGWASDVDAASRDRLVQGGKQVGVVTSACRDPRTGAGLGLGYARKAQSAPGARLATETGEAVEVIG